MVKFVGQDKSGNTGSQFKSPEFQAQVLSGSDKSFQFAQDQYNKTGEQLKSSLQFQSGIAQRMSEDFSNTNQVAAKTAISTMESQARSGDGFKQALGNLSNVGQAILQTLDTRAKREQASAKAVRDNNAATTWERISKWEVTAPEIARLDPAGTVKLHSQVEDILKTTEGADISAEDRQAIMKHAYGGVIAGLASKNVEDLMSQQQKVQQVNDNVATQRAIFESASLLSSLTNSSTQEQQAVATEKLSAFVGEIALNNELKPMRKAEIVLGLTQQMNKAVFSSEENRAKSLQVLANFGAFQEDVLAARAKYPDDIEQQETMIAFSMHRYSIPGNLADRYSPTKAQERTVHQQELNNKVRDLRDKEVAGQLGVGGTDNDAGYDAEMFPSEGNEVDYAASLANGNVKLGKETPAFIKYMSAKKAKKDFQKATVNYNKGIAEININKQNLGTRDQAANLAYLKSIKPSDQTPDLIKRLQIVTGNNPAMAQFLPLIGQYDAQDAAKTAAWDQAYSNATAQGFDLTRDLAAAYDAQEQALRAERGLAITELGRYGYRSDGTYNPDTAKMVERQRTEREAKINAAYTAQQQGLTGTGNNADGNPAPFRSGGGYFNGAEVFQRQQSAGGELIMPITKTALSKQGKANIGDGTGFIPSRGRNHNGQDIGVDLRTPIVAQMDGKIVAVVHERDTNSAGNHIKIKYADGSTHTFMHLYERPNLAVGQSIKAGQQVAMVGNTGLSGGNSNADNSHLHWEVHRSNGSLSSPQEWSQHYLKGQANRPKQPRGGGPGSSITAPNMQIPGVPVRGGVLTPDGKGGTTKVKYGNNTLTLDQLLSANAVPIPTKVDPSRAGVVVLMRTGLKDRQGLEQLVARVHDKSGKIVGQYVTNSGRVDTQNAFGPANSTQAGSGAPLEYGKYNIGITEDGSDIPGMRSDFINIEQQQESQRSLLGIHFDGDRAIKPGSVGCIAFPDAARFKDFQRQMRQHGSKTIDFVTDVYDTGQQKQRKPIPASMTFNNVNPTGSFLGPNGRRFTRDAQGNTKIVPQPVGYSSGGMSSSANTNNGANPIRNQVNSNRASDYNLNDLDNNHGFAALKKRPTLARAINESGKSLGVPGEWLAEVMSVETGNTFDPNQKEYGGSGATGLIQFFPDNDGGSTKTINGKVYNLDTIGRMTPEQQVRGPVMDYIKEAMTANNMKRIPTIQDMYALVYAYGNAAKARGMRDLRGASGNEILGRLGKFSGRKYSNTDTVNRNTNIASADIYSSDRANKLTTRIDNKIVAGCASCQMMASTDMFVPHERVNLNKGNSTFNLA